MKKITYLIISIIFLNLINSCTGYKPIYTSSLKFEIADYSIKSDEKLGKKIYYKLYNLSKYNQNEPERQSISITINSKKDKNATVNDSAGKVIEYRVSLTSNISIKDYLTDDEILNKTFSYSSAYKVQDQYTETLKLENQSIENLVNKIYQNLLIDMSQIISKK